MVSMDYLLFSEMVACSCLIHFFHFILITYSYFSIMLMLKYVILLDLKSTNTNLVSVLLIISCIMLAIGMFYYSLGDLRPLLYKDQPHSITGPCETKFDYQIFYKQNFGAICKGCSSFGE